MVRMPPRGSSLTIVKYVGDGELFPTIRWLRETSLNHDDKYWMVEFVRPAKLTDIPPDGSEIDPWQPTWVAWKMSKETYFTMYQQQQQQRQQPEEKLLTKIEQQQSPQQQQDRQAHACSAPHGLMQDEQPSPATKQMLPGASPPSKEARPSAHSKPCPKTPSLVPTNPYVLLCPQARQSHHQKHSSLR